MSRTGYIPSSRDDRDFSISGLTRVQIKEGPPKASLGHTIAVRDQGEVPCCVSCAIVTAMEAMDQQNPPSTMLSVLYLYYECRGGGSQLPNTMLRTGLKNASRGISPAALHEKMIIKELSLPDVEGNSSFTLNQTMAIKPPSAKAREAAKQYKIAWDDREEDHAYYRLPDFNRAAIWRYAILKGRPVIFGFRVSSQYKDLKNDTSGELANVTQTFTGGEHAVVALGYDDKNSLFEIKDSMGKSFGLAGRWHLPYNLVESDFIKESWIIGGITYD